MNPYYSDAAVTIYHGEASAVLHELPEASCDVLLTDPPYSSGGMFRGDRNRDPIVKHSSPSWSTGDAARGYGTFGGDNKDQWAWIRWVTAWSFSALRVVAPGGHSFMFTDWRQLPAATDALQFGGWSWQGLVVWDKGGAGGMPVKGRFRNTAEFVVWGKHGAGDRTEEVPASIVSVPTVNGADRAHVTQKPVQLLQHLLRVVPGEHLTVLDPFLGSGSTLVAARNLGHRCIGIEVEERYCEIAARRLDQGVLDFGAPA